MGSNPTAPTIRSEFAAPEDPLSLHLLGIVLAVTGIVALVVTLTKGPNLGISRRTGLYAGVVLLVIGVVLLVLQ